MPQTEGTAGVWGYRLWLSTSPWVDRTKKMKRRSWMDLSYYSEGEFEGWGGAFGRVVELTLQRGGKIHFNLTGIDIQDALAGDPSIWVGRYTAWELQQVVLRLELFEVTSFYLDGKRLSVEDVEALGIVRPQRVHHTEGESDDRDF